MDRENFVLATLASAGEGASYTPVQVQKLFFLIDEEGFNLVGEKYFDFAPYDYGPFDKEVYDELDELSLKGLVEVQNIGQYRKYILTEQGYKKGSENLNEFSEEISDYFKRLTSWIRPLTFQQLVRAIYDRYPEMKVNSVFST